jgi:hypothetical protein
MNQPQDYGTAGKIRWIEKKNPMTSSVIDPAIFRLVAQYPNHLRYRVLTHSDEHHNLYSWQNIIGC